MTAWSPASDFANGRKEIFAEKSYRLVQLLRQELQIAQGRADSRLWRLFYRHDLFKHRDIVATDDRQVICCVHSFHNSQAISPPTLFLLSKFLAGGNFSCH